MLVAVVRGLPIDDVAERDEAKGLQSGPVKIDNTPRVRHRLMA